MTWLPVKPPHDRVHGEVLLEKVIEVNFVDGIIIYVETPKKDMEGNERIIFRPDPQKNLPIEDQRTIRDHSISNRYSR